jgi:CRISPR-associated Cas5-like protein
LGYSLPTPGAPSFPKLNEYNPDTPTKYSFTYPTGKYNEQKTMYFPTKSALKAFTQGVRGATYQEGDSWASATGTLQDGGNVDSMGYWNPENWGKPVTIPSNEITMEGVYEPLIGISDTGDVQYMEPGEDYTFDGEYVTEYPMAKGGISVNNADAQPIKKLDQLLNFTNYNKPTKGGWLNKYR